MLFGEPHPFPERGPPTRLSNVGTVKLKRMIGKGSLSGVKQPGRGIDHPPHLAPSLKKVKLYLYSTSGPSWPVTGWPLPLPYRAVANAPLISSWLVERRSAEWRNQYLIEIWGSHGDDFGMWRRVDTRERTDLSKERL
jgi:hypothetical protein